MGRLSRTAPLVLVADPRDRGLQQLSVGAVYEGPRLCDGRRRSLRDGGQGKAGNKGESGESHAGSVQPAHAVSYPPYWPLARCERGRSALPAGTGAACSNGGF